MSKRQIDTELRTVVGTAGYLAPEILGLVASKRRGYTNAVDLWALGSLVHKILTLEVPFLDAPLDDGDDSILESGDLAPVEPSVDMKALYEYCHTSKVFPTETLRNFGVSEQGIYFVKSLMVPDPNGRMPVKEALESPWFRGSHL